ncbi:ornithine cyclodeaminase family protein [Sinorhizobium americanum]|uniref:Ornithine cyclodeaminase n=1 Tax=Sinorhizobium americanum TaxID=194963 RepID=A0A1L3LH33_9HYPH|nr:ornithine cyclodeaminase family protein [Sinorhizobium americanum]APG82875.1 ornithine cyclodeaminase/mu-crystallin family protein [Sinorhizobium americanum CCGM7]APG89414.1 ornithine cyclodeaminase/mu-crystallin family protein [Sinorhizobium americanum]OAP49305.1 ornithine cyclodeaminase [Sinorhizobium americanum]TCN19449.1 ornithine cyclodeaminase [Sinorhizobium americanum]
MLVLDVAQTRAALPWDGLVRALGEMFAKGCVMPVRHHHDVEVPGEADATLLIMPAWQPGAYIGVKMVSVFPGNQTRALPAIHGSYLLSSAKTGELLAILDGGELTARRTAAASALAARHLAREDAGRLLMVGTGRLSANVIEAHASVRPIRDVAIWGRDPKKAEATAKELDLKGVAVSVAMDLEAAAREADIVSCATLSSEPLIRGDWLKPGAHLDLIGAFKPSMRESDDRAAARASIFVDTRDGALSEGGDIVQPLRAGVITEASIRADLFELARGTHPGRTTPDEITLFKSVGAALEDLAGAVLAFEAYRGKA